MATLFLDADETLWKGIILQGADVEIILGVPEMLKEMKKRGHMVICVSKNSPENLNNYLVKHNLLEYFDAVHASWGPKSDAFRMYNLIHAVFVDDDPFNIQEVRHRFPEVQGIQIEPGHWDPLTLLDHPLFSRDTTDVDRQRVQLLREQRSREVAAHQAMKYSGNYTEFLRESELELTIYTHRAVLPDETRALDLLNRTNELRTAKKIYEELPTHTDTGTYRIFGASLKDKFGDYGQIATGLAYADTSCEEVVLEDLAISCRTAGRGLGSALVCWLLREVKDNGFISLIGIIKPTDKNTSMQQLYEYLGFERNAERDVSVGDTGEDDIQVWTYHMPKIGPLPESPAWFKSIREVR